MMAPDLHSRTHADDCAIHPSIRSRLEAVPGSRPVPGDLTRAPLAMLGTASPQSPKAKPPGYKPAGRRLRSAWPSLARPLTHAGAMGGPFQTGRKQALRLFWKALPWPGGLVERTTSQPPPRTATVGPGSGPICQQRYSPWSAQAGGGVVGVMARGVQPTLRSGSGFMPKLVVRVGQRAVDTVG